MSYAGCFLIAKPMLQDPNFQRTVVLLMAHSAEGAFGLVVNRPANTKDLPWPVFVGGPCPSPGLIMLHGHQDWIEPTDDDESEKERKLAPGIFSGDAACLDRVTQAVKEGETLRFRVFSGYAGWGSGQLEGELASGSWTLRPATGAILFGTPFAELWDRLTPPRIPEPSVN